MGEFIGPILFLLFIVNRVYMFTDNSVSKVELTASSYVYWQNATIPFYIVPDHFDREQGHSIMTTLALFAFKTCLKFVPVLSPPAPSQHVLVFANPGGVRKCVIDLKGHAMDEPHTVTLGYDCLRSPQIDMMVMRALGFPFEHNRASRDLFIEVLMENVDTSAIELFTKDSKLPLELRSLAYDADSVMHFGERDYSKNGHRTIIFKDTLHNPVKQNRNGLSPLDLRKIELVYGPECRKRDRQEKLELCQSYPGTARRKRDVDVENINLRVNRDVTPPPDHTTVTLNGSLKELGVETEVQDVVDQIYKVSAKALRNARAKYCNLTKTELRISDEKLPRNKTKPDLLGIIEAIADYTLNMVENAVANLTEFCAASENIETYQRVRPRCPFYGGRDCPGYYKSTKSGAVKYSTQHRPVYFQSTNHEGNPYKFVPYIPLREGNKTGSNGTEGTGRRKREVETSNTTGSVKVTNAEVRRRDDDDVTKVYNPRSKDDDEKKNVQARRDDVTRVMQQRSRDDDVTTVGYDEQSRRKRSDTTSGGKDGGDATVVDDKASSMVTSEAPKSTANGTSSSKGDLRAGTEIPEKKSVAYDREWPFPERHHRRGSKIRKRARSDTENNWDWDASGLSLEKKESRHKSDRESRPRKKQKSAGRAKKKHSPQRQRESADQDLLLAQMGGSEEDDRASLPPITVPLSKANQEFYSERKWLDGVVRYVLVDNPNYDMADVRTRLDEVNDILRAKTCARIEEVSESEARNHHDYLVIDTGADFVTGRVGGRQGFGCLELFRGGQHRQHAAMVVMAMLGFYFELARHDRDKYVRVHLRHVRPDKLHHFEKIRADATFPLAYDYESATHPAWQFWRKVGKTGISTVATYKSRDPKGDLMKSLGQHEKLLSELDLVKINSVYGTKCFQDRGRERASRGKKGRDRIRTIG